MLVWCFFSILPKCLFVIIVMYVYSIDISQGSVAKIWTKVKWHVFWANPVYVGQLAIFGRTNVFIIII